MIFFKKTKDYEDFNPDELAPSMSQSQELFLVRWLEKCGDRPGYVPPRSDFPPHKFARHMPSVVIFNVLNNPQDFKYRLFGGNVREHSSADFTGKLLSELPGKGPDSKIWYMLDQTRLNGAPLYKQVPYVGPSVSVKASTVLFLPMADDHKTIDRIFLVTNFIK